MKKYIDADKLKAEIERRYAEYRAKMKTDDFTYYEGMADALDLFEQYIDSLQQEPQEVDLEKEIEKYYYDNFAFISSAHTPTMDIVSDIATHFYELGQRRAAEMYDEIEYNRQRAEEETLGKTLDEAAEEYENELLKINLNGNWSEDIHFAFKAGAKWMAGQSSTKDGEVTDGNDFIKFNDGTYIDLRPDLASKSFDLKTGDRVIVQVRKKEESK